MTQAAASPFCRQLPQLSDLLYGASAIDEKYTLNQGALK